MHGRFVVTLGLVAGCCANGVCAADAPSDPSAYVYDTGKATPAALSGGEVRGRAGWIRLAEDDTTHVFRGAAGLANDRLSLVVRPESTVADLYGRSDRESAARAAIGPLLGSPGAFVKLTSWKIIENNPGAVMLEARFRQPSGTDVKISYRLTAGQPVLEVRVEPAGIALTINCPAQHIVVPDFFGDDIFIPSPRRGRISVPAENFFLGLVGSGTGLVMCVWKSPQRTVEAHFAPGRGSPNVAPATDYDITGWTIGPGRTGSDPTVWVALMEAENIWHARTPGTRTIPFSPPTQAAAENRDNPQSEVTLDWKPPFAAKWRAGVAGPTGIAASWYFRQGDDEPASADSHSCPGCLDAAGARVVLGRLSVQPASRPQPLLIYPIDRSRATPLTVFCPIDILRATLGMGPCQYILQTEGLASESNPTPDNVMTWVEKQFSKKKQKKEADEIRRLLDEMVGHMRHAETRLDRYADLTKSLQAILAAGGNEAALAWARDTLEYMRSALAPVTAAVRPSAQARKLANEVVSFIDRDEAAAECQRLGREIRRQGAFEEAALARCRLAARWLRAQATSVGNDHGAEGQRRQIVEQIQSRVEAVLENEHRSEGAIT